MEELKDIELIDRYLTRSLTELERSKVDQRLNNDAGFHALFDDVKEAVFAVQLAEEDKVRAILKEEQAKMTTTSVVELKKMDKKSFILRGWLAAASVGLLIVMGYWFFTKNDTFTFEPKQNTWIKIERDAATFQEERKRIIAENGTIEGEKLLEGLKLYESGLFDKAAKELLTINIKNDTLSLYQANALLQTNATQQAISILEKIPSNSSVSMEKDWYLAMAYWQLREISKAKNILLFISNNPNHDWQIKAQELLSKKPFL